MLLAHIIHMADSYSYQPYTTKGRFSGGAPGGVQGNLPGKSAPLLSDEHNDLPLYTNQAHDIT